MFKLPLFALLILVGCAQTKQTTLPTESLDEQLSQIEKNDSNIVWFSFEKGVELSKFSNKNMFIDVYTDWCGWCKKMDASTFKNEAVVSYMNKNYIAVKLNAEQRDTLRFNNTNFTFVNSGRRGYHQLAALLLDGQMSYPSFAILSSDGRRVKKIVGYQSTEQLIPALSLKE